MNAVNQNNDSKHSKALPMLGYAINAVTAIQYFTQRVTTESNKQGHITTPNLISIKLTSNSTL